MAPSCQHVGLFVWPGDFWKGVKIMPLFHVAQDVTKTTISEDSYEITTVQAKLANGVIVAFGE